VPATPENGPPKRLSDHRHTGHRHSGHGNIAHGRIDRQQLGPHANSLAEYDPHAGFSPNGFGKVELLSGAKRLLGDD
jgi:hypothetical protein